MKKLIKTDLVITICIKILKYELTFLRGKRLINLPHEGNHLIELNGALLVAIRLHKQLVQIVSLLLEPLNNFLIDLAQFILSFFLKIELLIFIVEVFGRDVWLLLIEDIELEQVDLELFYLDSVVFVYVEFCE